MTDPAGARSATLSAAAKVPPQETPQKIPSFCASACAVVKEMSADTGMTSSMYPLSIDSCATNGMKSGVQP